MQPTRSWCFRTVDVEITFGEYKPEADEPAWGLDMFALGPHDFERTAQPTGDGLWAKPSWAADAPVPEFLTTDRAILMEGDRPLLPGSSVRGPLRHTLSRAERAAGRDVKDPHLVRGDVGADDVAGKAFGTVRQSSRILIRDACAQAGWAAAKLHMHAEDEFSAGSYGSAKRDAVRVLRGVFPVRIAVEGPTPEEVEPLVKLVDRQVALGALGHLPMGGHKTRGAGWGRWRAKPWKNDDVHMARDWAPPREPESPTPHLSESLRDFIECPEPTQAWVQVTCGSLDSAALSLGAAAKLAKAALGGQLIAWWCDPTIDLALLKPPETFGRTWPGDENQLQVDEVAFYAERAVWRAARTATGTRFVLIQECGANEDGARPAKVTYTPARLHNFRRFSSARTGPGSVLLREWHFGDEILGFTVAQIAREQP